MGLWLLSECVRDWERSGETISLPELLAQAAAVTGPVPVFDADDESFLAPGDMPARIASWFARARASPLRRRGPSWCARSCRASRRPTPTRSRPRAS